MPSAAYANARYASRAAADRWRRASSHSICHAKRHLPPTQCARASARAALTRSAAPLPSARASTQAGGAGVIVASITKRTAADFRLRDPDEVQEFLERVAAMQEKSGAEAPGGGAGEDGDAGI